MIEPSLDSGVRQNDRLKGWNENDRDQKRSYDDQTLPCVPDLQTVAEGGVPGYEVVLWYGVLGPKGLPKNIVERWNTEIRKATKIPGLKERLISEGFDIDEARPRCFRQRSSAMSKSGNAW